MTSGEASSVKEMKNKCKKRKKAKEKALVTKFVAFKGTFTVQCIAMHVYKYVYLQVC